ncbi:hypothetical protein QLS71_004230 [Mariniflexile litorale]|uniref:Uncharacterized protein n=1 Tax=Mariniflexile litorale TaxID=3045158 RepID=A0AAU7EJD5_9FLAO|nr:hypothetical protein [Mariniflexile sp. KMM 9835]MDQ8210226.1 hypothetical protein [Mariniflexile sp. KMM 9835]
MFSTVSFTIEKHFCGDVLVDVSVFTEAQKCIMGAFETDQQTIRKKICCKDEVNVIQGQDNLRLTSFEDFNFQQQLFIASFTYTFISVSQGLAEHVIPHKNYSPPHLVADIQVLDQVFII